MNGMALFAGIGGLELGIKLAIPTYRTLVYVEREAYCAANLVARFTECESTMGQTAFAPAPVWDDIETFDAKRWAESTNLISAGWPCTDISLAGTGKGLDGERSGLWREVARCIREVGPDLVLLENSPALTVRGLDRVLGDLAECGYDAAWDVFSAGGSGPNGCGAPHLRRRIFILAKRVPDAVSESVRHKPERGQGVALPAERGDAEPRHLGEDLADAQRARLEGFRRDTGGEEEPEFRDDCGTKGGGSQPLETDSDVDSVRLRGGSIPLRDSQTARSRLPMPSDRPVGNGPVHGADSETFGQSVERSGLADADSRGREVVGSGRVLDGKREAFGDDADGRSEWRPWPPGPNDDDGWRDYIDAGGPSPALSKLRGGSDGLPTGLVYRNDRLRSLGNAVSPICAALALRTLAARLGVSLDG